MSGLSFSRGDDIVRSVKLTKEDIIGGSALLGLFVVMAWGSMRAHSEVKPDPRGDRSAVTRSFQPPKRGFGESLLLNAERIEDRFQNIWRGMADNHGWGSTSSYRTTRGPNASGGTRSDAWDLRR